MLALILAAFIAQEQPVPAAQTIDRLVAVVGGEPIFLSDVREVVRLRLLDSSASLEQLIDRRLILAEVARYPAAAPSAAEIDAEVKQWAARFTSVPAHDVAMVRAFLADTLRIERYIDQRFTAAAQPTRDEARAFYQANPTLFARDGVTVPFEQVEDDARRRLAEDRRAAMVRDWLGGLRERGDVRILR